MQPIKSNPQQSNSKTKSSPRICEKKSLNPLYISILVLTLLTTFLLGCHPTTRPSQQFPDTLASGDTATVQLNQTAPDQIEENPLFHIQITTTDAITSQPIPADTFLHQRNTSHEAIKQVNTIFTIPCEEAHQCNLTLTPIDAEWVWVIQTRSPGYQDHIIELSFSTKSSRILTMPIQLQPIPDQSQG